MNTKKNDLRANRVEYIRFKVRPQEVSVVIDAHHRAKVRLENNPACVDFELFSANGGTRLILRIDWNTQGEVWPSATVCDHTEKFLFALNSNLKTVVEATVYELIDSRTTPRMPVSSDSSSVISKAS